MPGTTSTGGCVRGGPGFEGLMMAASAGYDLARSAGPDRRGREPSGAAANSASSRGLPPRPCSGLPPPPLRRGPPAHEAKRSRSVSSCSRRTVVIAVVKASTKRPGIRARGDRRQGELDGYRLTPSAAGRAVPRADQHRRVTRRRSLRKPAKPARCRSRSASGTSVSIGRPMASATGILKKVGRGRIPQHDATGLRVADDDGVANLPEELAEAKVLRRGCLALLRLLPRLRSPTVVFRVGRTDHFRRAHRGPGARHDPSAPDPSRSAHSPRNEAAPVQPPRTA